MGHIRLVLKETPKKVTYIAKGKTSYHCKMIDKEYFISSNKFVRKVEGLTDYMLSLLEL